MKKHLLLFVLFFACLPALIQAQAPVNVQKSNPKPVYMHIMPWFDGPMTLGAGNWGYHWKMHRMNPNVVDGSGRRQIASHYYPEIGPYDSSDPDVVDYQLLLMKLSGVDGVLIDWYGTAGTVGDIGTNLRNSNAIVNGTAPAGMKFALIIEDRFTGGNVNTQRNSMLYARDNYFNRSNYFRFGPSNSPLVGIFGPTSIQYASGWNTILSGIDTEFLTLEYQGAEVGGNLDGEYAWPYQSPGTSDHYTQVENFYRNRAPGLRTSMGIIYPGFHDFYAQGENGGSTLFNIPFNGTGTLNQLMNLANQYKNDIDIIQLATWNDYGEGTMFEPTREFGYSFLVKLQQFTGVPYTENDLKQVTRYYNLRKKYAGNASVKTKLDQVYKYFAALQISNAVALMCTIESDGNCTVAAPVINSSLSASGSVGSSFNYTITASNAPTSYSATGLPSGLSLNTGNGVISGTPTAAATSNVTIRATNAGGTDTKTLVLTINNTACVTVQGISLNTSALSLSSGQTGQLTATVSPSNACNKSVNWSSSNTSVATVSGSGTVTALAAGTATITASTVDQNRVSTAVVTVTASGSTTKYYRIKNRWQGSFYLYDGGNQLSYGTGNDQSYQWTLEDVGGGNMEIKNRATSEYMHVEHLLNYVEATPRTSGWYSSRWAVENAGGGYVRFRNAWQSNQYIHIENLYGYAQHTSINTAWASAQWLLEEVTTSTPPVQNPSSVLIQAENYSSMNGVQTESTTDTGGGLNVGWIDTGDWMAFAGINFPTSGAYTVEYRVASPSGATLSLDLNSGSIQLGTVAIPATGGWQTWTTVSHIVNVNAGTYSVGVYAPASGWNINWIRITKQGSARTSDDDASSSAVAAEAAMTLYPNPTENLLHIFSNLDLGAGEIAIMDIVGQEVYRTAGSESIDVSSLSAGSYTLVFTGSDNQRQVLRFVKR